MNLSNLGVGIVIAFVYSWAVTLVIIAFLPFLIIGGVLQTQMLTGFASKDKEVIEQAGKVILLILFELNRNFLISNQYFSD